MATLYHVTKLFSTDNLKYLTVASLQGAYMYPLPTYHPGKFCNNDTLLPSEIENSR